jgi:phosphoribosyl-ATP pyrophosphohydrolase/phosphoribosyl-AMP cyclohydrolase
VSEESPGSAGARLPDLAWDARGLLPVVVQAADSGEVLMVAWMNAEALRKTLETGRAHFWSRSRQALWPKGETSGHVQVVEAVYADCDRDTLLLLVRPAGPACHTGNRTCFFQRVDRPGERGAGEPATREAWEAAGGILDTVERVVEARRAEPREGSYVSRLLAGGDAAVLKKIGEESAEVIVAALGEGPDRLVAEVADLWFHTLVLLGARGLSVRQVLAELARRHRPPGVG